MNIKSILRLSYLALFVIVVLQSCEDNSFGEDMEISVLPTELSYPEITNAREFSYIETSSPFMNSNGHVVIFEIISITKDDIVLDDSYTDVVSIVNATDIEYTNPLTDETETMKDLSEMGKIIIEAGNPFGYGDYYFKIKISATVNGKPESAVFDNAFHLNIGPGLVEGLSYCPNKFNFVSGGTTASNPAELFGGNSDVRFELGSESDKLNIDPVTGAITLNSGYNITDTEYLNPIINVVSNVSAEIVSFEDTFLAVPSTAPVVLEKESDYFFFPNLIPVSKDNLALGGDGWSRQVVQSHSDDDGWYNPKAIWQAKTPPVNTPDAIAVRDDSGVMWTQRLQVPLWTLQNPHDSWVVMDPVNLALYEGCFDSKAVFWYALFLNEIQAGYEADGSTPIGLEVHITNNYTGDVTTTEWTQVNDILECEINNNGTIFTGTPYPGNQSGIQPPNGVKDPAKNANKLWVRGELNLEDYKTEEAFTIAFRLKTYFETEPYHLDTNGQPAVNGWVRLSNVHFVALEK